MSEAERILKKTNRLNLFTTKMLRGDRVENKAMIKEFQSDGRVLWKREWESVLPINIEHWEDTNGEGEYLRC